MFLLIGLTLNFFLVTLILVKKKRSMADSILLIWLSFTFLHVLLFYLQVSGRSYSIPHTLGILLPFPALHGVFLYVYTVNVTSNKFPRPVQLVTYCIPFLLLVVMAIPFYSLTGDEKIHVFKNEGIGFEWYMITQNVLIIVTGFFYTYLTWKEIIAHQRRVKQEYSNIDKKMLTWLQYLSVGLGSIWILALAFDESIIFAGVILFVFFIGYFGINQVPIFHSLQENKVSAEPAKSKSEEDQAEELTQYKKSSLTALDLNVIMERIELYMKTEKPYKNNDLTLKQLADNVNLPVHQVSQAINATSENTFYSYINTYRIHEFLTLSSSPESAKFTLQSLAFECGFNSKTTFNKYFKLVTGKTPSEYLTIDNQSVTDK